MKKEMLKLRAKDAEDIQVISAVLQDAILPVCDITFEPEDKTFIAVAQRLRREPEEAEIPERICCALTIKGVKSVQTHGVDQRDPEGMLDLLAIILEPAHILNFIFAGDARIRLELETLSGAIEDFGEPWPAFCHPCHDNAAQKTP
jgi:hypothetical protein